MTLFFWNEKRGRLCPARPWYASRVCDVIRALKLAWDIWRKPWQPKPDYDAEDFDPRCDIDLQTALDVAWIVWR